MTGPTCADCGRRIGDRERRHERSPGQFVCLPCHRSALDRHLALANQRLAAILRYERTHAGTGLWAQSTSDHDPVHLVIKRDEPLALCGTTAPRGWTQPGDYAPLCRVCEAVAFGTLRAAA